MIVSEEIEEGLQGTIKIPGDPIMVASGSPFS